MPYDVPTRDANGNLIWTDGKGNTDPTMGPPSPTMAQLGAAAPLDQNDMQAWIGRNIPGAAKLQQAGNQWWNAPAASIAAQTPQQYDQDVQGVQQGLAQGFNPRTGMGADEATAMRPAAGVNDNGLLGYIGQKMGATPATQNTLGGVNRTLLGLPGQVLGDVGDDMTGLINVATSGTNVLAKAMGSPPTPLIPDDLPGTSKWWNARIPMSPTTEASPTANMVTGILTGDALPILKQIGAKLMNADFQGAAAVGHDVDPEKAKAALKDTAKQVGDWMKDQLGIGKAEAATGE
jgi:hypothetical protein